MPTEEQIKSREELKAFVDRVSKPIRGMVRNIKSAWFSRPDDELKGWIERGRALNEIADSLGYRLIMTQTEKEISWAQAQLEICETKDVDQLRMYLKALRFLKDFVLTTERNADIASTVLAGREGQIARETMSFVRNARVEN
jgi:hypothetical protein